MASSAAFRSSASMTMTGTSRSPARRAAPPAALAGNDLVIAGGQTADRQGLDDTVDADGFGQIGQRLLVKALPGLVQPRLHLGNGQGDGALPLGGQVRVTQQGIEARPSPSSMFRLAIVLLL